MYSWPVTGKADAKGSAAHDPSGQDAKTQKRGRKLALSFERSISSFEKEEDSGDASCS
jgi:hypothetical protein